MINVLKYTISFNPIRHLLCFEVIIIVKLCFVRAYICNFILFISCTISGFVNFSLFVIHVFFYFHLICYGKITYALVCFSREFEVTRDKSKIGRTSHSQQINGKVRYKLNRYHFYSQ